MKIALLMLLLFRVSHLLLGQTSTCLIDGHVYQADGKPLANSKIDILPLEATVSGPLPWTTTQTDGAFHLAVPALGKTRVYASLERAGFPEAQYKLFSSRQQYFPEVIVSSGCSLSPIEIHLGPPDGSIAGAIVDKVSGQPIRNARITLRWVEDPTVMDSQNSQPDGSFYYSLPDRPMSMEVNATGYRRWTYKDAFGSDLEATSIDRKKLTIQLDRTE